MTCRAWPLVLCWMLVLTASSPAQEAALFDELAAVYPDTKVSDGADEYAGDTPRGVPAGVHVLVTGLKSGQPVAWSIVQDGATEQPATNVYRLVDVPVEQNTGLTSRTEAWDKKENPYVVRRAPFRVYEVLEPVERTAQADEAGVLALRIEVPVGAHERPGPRAYEIRLRAGEWSRALRWRLTVYAATVPPVHPGSPGYTNWFSTGLMAQRHDVTPWSEDHWRMIGQYADLMHRGRQNTFIIRWADFFENDETGRPSINRDRLRRYVRLFMDRGFTMLEGGHLAHRHEGDWNSDRLDLTLTGHDVTSDEGKEDLHVILREIRSALLELGLPPMILYVQHLSDEPTDKNAEAYRALAAQVRLDLPHTRIFETTMSQALVDSVDIWCPQVQEYEAHRGFFIERQEAGDGIWVYTCLIPGGPWLNRLLDQERVRPVYLGWSLVHYHLDGFLHWGLNHYRSGVDPYQQSVVPHGTGAPNFLPAGDSHVVYPGADGPRSGLRFEAHRIGLEDAELLTLLRARDAEGAARIIDLVFRSYEDYERDFAVYRLARRRLLEALSPSEAEADAADAVAVMAYSFDKPEDATAFSVRTEGEGQRKGSEPKLYENKLYLLQSWWKFTASAAFAAPTLRLAGRLDARWTMVMNTGSEGAGFAWLDVEKHGPDGPAPEVDAWEAPNIAGSFAVGFDARNPPNRDPFRGSGNVYDRPQHEVSLHWDGREIVKRMAPMEFRDERPHDIRVSTVFVCGGAEVSVRIDDTAIFDRYFIAGMMPYVGRPAFGGRNEETAGDVLIDDVHMVCDDPVTAPQPPLSITAIDRQINDAQHHTNEAVVTFPEQTDDYGRIICTLRLDKPETRFDPWDRIAHIYLHDDEGNRWELVRYITPYHRGGEWKIDVTDFRPLLTGTKKIEQACTTYAEGWVVSVTFDFYPGKPERLAHTVIPLWSGDPEIGNPEKPVSEFYTPRIVPLDHATGDAKVRIVVSGHGMSPNTDNAAEFMPLDRTLVLNGRTFHNLLWKTDNYLNPCRPQGGTWKYDRAGWAPGDVVRPWEVDASALIDAAESLNIEYHLDPYINEARGQTWAPTHRTEAVLILYRGP